MIYIIAPTTVTRGRYSIIFYYTSDIIKYIHNYVITERIIYDVSFYYAIRRASGETSFEEVFSYYAIS